MKLVEEDSYYSLDGELGISLTAESRSELESALDELLRIFWQKFALAESSSMSESGLQLKRELNERISIDKLDVL